MPELAEVYYNHKQWLRSQGALVERVLVNEGKRVFRKTEPEALHSQLAGKRLCGGSTSGKQMWFTFGPDVWLGVHLGMAGRLSRLPCADDYAKHDHLVLEMNDGYALVYNDYRLFGLIRSAKSETAPDWAQPASVSILSEAYTLQAMEAFLDKRSAPIKALLLDQVQFPGIGNWMADEILWRAAIHPARSGSSLSQSERNALFGKVREVAQDAMDVIGGNYDRPPDAWLFNHRWKNGGTCPITRVKLERAKIGGRTTCWSPKRQFLSADG